VPIVIGVTPLAFKVSPAAINSSQLVGTVIPKFSKIS
jgi:hypothetical protein